MIKKTILTMKHGVMISMPLYLQYSCIMFIFFLRLPQLRTTLIEEIESDEDTGYVLDDILEVFSDRDRYISESTVVLSM